MPYTSTFYSKKGWPIQTLVKSPKLGNTFKAYKDGDNYHTALAFLFLIFP